jgi:hypothetical protein
MEINKDIQYNQSIGKYKVLSSNAGVGSIITNKAGFFIMPQTVSLWGFIRTVNKQIENFPDQTNPNDIAKRAGVDAIDDPRFIEFLKKEQGIPNLMILADVPHLSLSEWNYPNTKEHPLFKRNKEINNTELPTEHFVIPAIHFPRWFYSNRKKLFKPIEEWKSIWKREQCNGGDLKYFAPPRDPYSKKNRTFKDNNQIKDIYEPLVQIPMLLICKNGHISDIPWYQLFCAGIDGKKRELSNENGFELFDYECQVCEQSGKHDLQWIENRNSSESWGVLKCKKCGKTHSLEGIMNIKPFCKGETPWNGIGTKSEPCKASNGTRATMQMALVTSNSVYYADSFSSLYIPACYLSAFTLSTSLQKVLDLLNTKWYKKACETNPLLEKEEFWRSIDIRDKADDAGFSLSENDAQIVKNNFIQRVEPEKDSREKYRYDEYKVFTEHDKSVEDSHNLEFSDIHLPEILKPFFKKIQQVNILALTGTQLGFSRVSLPSPKRIDGIVKREAGQHIYNEPVEKVFTLPANQTFGEGLFFEFNRSTVDAWTAEFDPIFKKRFDQPSGELGKSLKDEMEQYGASTFYLLHTFSHLILKELEFSCGYPTASLQERLYYSDRMCGVLIYTTDGAEGSMGGLVWQGQPKLIEKIIVTALERAKDCSSDPLCWEADDQLNLAACFSCCLVSETSCEQRNLGLDRRALIDDEFGFFRNYDKTHTEILNSAYDNDPLCKKCDYKTSLSETCDICLDPTITQSPLERMLFVELSKAKIKFQQQYGLNRDGEYILTEGREYDNPDYNFTDVLTILDFYIEKGDKKLCVYTDGHIYHERTEEQATRDREIDRQLQVLGYTVLRYTGKEVREEIGKIIEEINNLLK